MNNRAKIDSKIEQNRAKSRPGGGLGGFWLQKVDQNGRLEGVEADYGFQARPKMRLGRFLCDFGANITPSWRPKPP